MTSENYCNIEQLEHTLENWKVKEGLDVGDAIAYWHQDKLHKKYLKIMKVTIDNTSKKVKMRDRLRKKLEEKNKNKSS